MKTHFIVLSAFIGVFAILNAKPTQPVTAQINASLIDTNKDYKQITCTLTPIDRTSRHASHPHIPARRGLQDYSTNWSGYVAQTNFTNPLAGSVNSVSGSWIVPSISSAQNNASCSFWVGIDGYSTPTVEQIGTEHDWWSGTAQHYAWFEMHPGRSYLINNFPLRPGDVISASVSYTGKNVFTMTIYNNTQRVSFTVPTSYTISSNAQRKSAEWVIEAPYWNGILPLSNFGTGYMWGCKATINGINGTINTESWANSAITMITNTNTIKATPSGLLQDGGSFFVVWQHQ